MSLYAMSEGVELATLNALDSLAARYDDPWQVVFDGGPATVLRPAVAPLVVHPAARLGSAVDDVMVAGLSVCPGCGAAVREACRWDCSSHWREGR